MDGGSSLWLRTARSRGLYFVLALCLIPIGLGTRAGNSTGWLNNYGGGVVYVLFWCFASRLVWVLAPSQRIALGVFAATCGVEFLQLWHPAWLEVLRSTTIGSMLFGSVFDPLDFLHSGIAAAGGFLILRWLERPRGV